MKIIIKDTLISVATDGIVQYLKSKSVSLVTDVRYSNERDPQGQLTSFKNRDCYTFALAPLSPILQRNVSIYGRQCRLFQDGEFQKDCKILWSPRSSSGISCVTHIMQKTISMAGENGPRA